MSFPCKRCRRRDGQTTAEFALIVPLILFIVMAIIQMGLIMRAYLSIVDATQLAARAVTVGRHTDQVTAFVLSRLSTFEGDSITVSISPVDELRLRGTEATVAVTYDMNLFIPFVNLLVSNPLPLKYTTSTSVETLRQDVYIPPPE